MASLRTLPVAVLCLAFAASAGRAAEGTEEGGLWRVRSAQTIMGVFGGSLGALLGGVAGFLLMPPCFSDGIHTADARAAAVRGCGDYGVPVGLALGAFAGASLGIYGVGRSAEGEGSYLATAGGAAVGLAAGISLSIHARPRTGYAYALTAGLTTLSGLAAYHWTDRVRLRAAWEGGTRKPGGKAEGTKAASLRPELQVTLVRF